MKNCIGTMALLTLIFSTQTMNAGLDEFIQGVTEHRFNGSMCLEFGTAFLAIKNHLASCDNANCRKYHQQLIAQARDQKDGMLQYCTPFFESLKEQDALAERYKKLNAEFKSSN
jgi:hypothetical protein